MHDLHERETKITSDNHTALLADVFLHIQVHKMKIMLRDAESDMICYNFFVLNHILDLILS